MASLEKLVDSSKFKDTVAEELQDHYKEVEIDGKKVHELQVNNSNDPSISKIVTELKNNNEQTSKKFETMEKQLNEAQEKLNKYSDIDVDKYKQLLSKVTDNKEDDSNVQSLVLKRTEELNKAHTKELEAKNARITEQESILKELKKTVNTTKIEKAVEKSINELRNDNIPIRKDSKEFFIELAKGRFNVEDDGNLIARGEDGNVIYGSDAQPLTVNAWLKSTSAKYPYLQEVSKGGNALGSDSRGGLYGAKVDSRKTTKEELAKVLNGEANIKW